MTIRADRPSNGSRTTTLSTLAVGAKAVVRDVRGERSVARRLMEMGVLPGTPIEVVRIAPLGDPVELRLRGYALSIRHAEAAQVQVEVA